MQFLEVAMLVGCWWSNFNRLNDRYWESRKTTAGVFLQRLSAVFVLVPTMEMDIAEQLVLVGVLIWRYRHPLCFCTFKLLIQFPRLIDRSVSQQIVSESLPPVSSIRTRYSMLNVYLRVAPWTPKLKLEPSTQQTRCDKPLALQHLKFDATTGFLGVLGICGIRSMAIDIRERMYVGTLLKYIVFRSDSRHHRGRD